MSTEAQIDAALEAVVSAARHHRAALRAGAPEEQIWRAYVALNNATVRYDDLISEVYDEVTPWDCEYLEAESDAPEPGPDEPPLLPPLPEVPATDGGALMVSVRHRRDYVIPQPTRLLTLATEARRTSWAGVDATHAARPVTDIGEAVNELVQAGDGTVAALDAYPEDLVPGNGVLVVNAVRRPLTFADAPANGGPDPLLLGPDEAQLYRMDEEIVDEDTLDEPVVPAASLW
ncbi:hypothetical protein [Cryptosporangium minutisporangium]|uniref:Uncharacterized protein n=1 Tax=Cryptosporangium minutisporangium TaxID=113569 RepID=A0ABP6T9S8_9ACTN